MKLKSAICLALATSCAHAVYLNPRGTGEALVYPYYTVNGGNAMLLSIVNSTGAGKAVKVRFLEGYDGRLTYDFNLYLAPFDVWVGQVVPIGDGAGLFTQDNSCTVPALAHEFAAAVPFSTHAFDGSASTPTSTDGGPTDVSRTREGWVEVIEMGEVTNASHGTLTAITHQNGVPNDCGQLLDAWNGYWKTDPGADLSAPTGGLSGVGMIIDVSFGTVEGYRAEALAQFYSSGSQPQHTAAGAATPNLAAGSSKTSTVMADDGVINTSFETSVDAVSSVFMVSSIANEYATASSIGASTEWVFTAPTKPFYTDPMYLTGTDAIAPFDAVFADGKSCSGVTYDMYDRNEAEPPPSVSLPPPDMGFSLCTATQVLAFNQSGLAQTVILGSRLRTDNRHYDFKVGWLQASLRRGVKHRLVGLNGNTFYGLPVVGFSVTQYINGTLTDDTGRNVQSNYTALIPHQSTLQCDRGTPPQPCS